MNSKIKNKILLPRGYLSHSARILWESSKEKYRAKYYFGEEGFQESKEMKYGKKFHDAAENGEDDDILIDSISALIPKYKKRNFEIRVAFNGIILLGRLDTFSPKTKSFREYKTGKHPWTQAKVDADEQITTYYALIYLKHKKFPLEVWLDWIETEEVGGKIAVTGRTKSFQTKRTLTQILRMANKFKKAAQEISNDYQIELNSAIPNMTTKPKNEQRKIRKMAGGSHQRDCEKSGRRGSRGTRTGRARSSFHPKS